jgi:hypothetical protein
MAGAFAAVAAPLEAEYTKNFVLPEKGAGGGKEQDGLAAPKPGRPSKEQEAEAKVTKNNKSKIWFDLRINVL